MGFEPMKTKYILLTVALLSLFITSASAQWSALNSGYAITTNYHGEDVAPETAVNATAGTTDANVQNVTFVWHFPDGTDAFTDPNVPVYSNGTTWTNSSGSFLIYYANSSHAPDVIGDWGVQAFFNGPGGHLRGQHSDIVAIRATSFNVIPEVPVIGTAGAVAVMLLGLGLFRSRRKSKTI